MKHKFFPRLQDVLFVSIFLAVIQLGPRLINTDGDLPRHLTMGRYIIQNLAIPTVDVFSHTVNGQPFAPHEWLAGVIFYALYYFWGLNGIIIFAGTLIASTFTILYWNGVERTGLKLPIFLLMIFGAMVSSLHWIARPHLLTMFFLAIMLILTERLATKQDVSLWVFPFLMLIWVNTHGEFLIGLLIIGTYLAGWAWDYVFHKSDTKPSTGLILGSAGMLSLIASLINPAGFRIWTTAIGYINNKYLTSHTVEYNPPNFNEPKFWVLLAFIIFSIYLVALNKQPTKTSHFLMLAGFGIMSLVSARNIHLYGVVGPFALVATISGSRIHLITKQFDDLIRKIEIPTKSYFWPIAVVVIFIFASTLEVFKDHNKFDPAMFPVDAVTWLKTNPQNGNMFNYFNWGGYLLLNLWPNNLVFIDGQTDVYGEAVTRQYEQVITMAPGWIDVLDQYQVKWIIIPAHFQNGKALTSLGWHQVYMDDTAVIIVK